MILFRKSNFLIKHCQRFTRFRLFSKINLKEMSEQERLETLRKLGMSQCRSEPIILKLDSPDFHSIFTEELTCLVDIFKKYGHQIRIAGGAVRDLLMGLAAKDLDFATTATPTQMKDMFVNEGIRMINTNGEKHGTITARINDKANFEVTSLRLDVICDGRRAEVQFITDWMIDALRRDLTINSMFLDFDGNVHDYFYGYEDLQSRKIRFVGDGATRIQEDYLRILRYFRFYGRIAQYPDCHDPDTIKAICDNRNGLAAISGERIWTELKKILEGNFAAEILSRIIQCEISSLIGLPAEPNLVELQKVSDRAKHLSLHPITFLVSVLDTIEAVHNLHARLKLSAFERDLALFVAEYRNLAPHPKPLLPYQQLIMKPWAKCTSEILCQYVVEVLKYNNSHLLNDFCQWTIPIFPVSGKMLKNCGIKPGRHMGKILQKLKSYWADREFNADSKELLALLPKIQLELMLEDDISGK